MAQGEPTFGSFIRAAREGKRLTIRAAAKAAGISEARWRQLEAGYQTVGGVRVPAVPKARTARLMADAVYVSPERACELAGYPHDHGGLWNPDSTSSREQLRRLTTQIEHEPVGPDGEDALPAFRYQRPPGLTDQEWDDLRRQHADYWDWLVERASRER